MLFLALAFGLSSCKTRPKYIRDVIEPSKPRPPSPQENSEVNIKPVVIDAQSQPNLNIGQSFFIKEGRLFDKTSHEFIMRGISNPHNYWKEKAFNVLPLLQDSKFNTVRIVWCADTLIRTGRCEPKDVFPIEELVRILQELRARAMVGVLNLQNATGSDSSADLQAMVEYLLKPEVKQVLLEYQDMLLLNIANEWYGTMDSPGSNFNGANYKSGLSKAIKS
ncbi:MAG: hypothetical protein NTX25_12135 [Proteobacteria bacterium]|nr:hypothetical protein [Pseudomonadota bacterium]